ncbi:sterol regulatory element binding protein Sre1 [Hirsutella rhossiliensis]|uniref:Sterol regulatory element binding protein Sre1 n=1 Tax=Hirsutella rhossiliensis TaxID=111463 RepID=A0A9P8MRE2_9HYPO|nr:sterol regulatory element binding protein Sre1 [Hirsutella rhossiliensis]KAH0958811.1 sterol regulatory element binding protein Sre1 [Hirsutella rhossiliensis]
MGIPHACVFPALDVLPPNHDNFRIQWNLPHAFLALPFASGIGSLSTLAPPRLARNSQSSMAEDDSTGRFGLDEPVFGFMGDASAVSDSKLEASNAPSDSSGQAFYGSSPWDFQVNPTFDSFDVNPAGTAPPVSAGSVAPSWPLPAFDQPQQQPQQQPQSQSHQRPQPHPHPQSQAQASSPSFDGFPPPNVDPTTVFGPGQGNPGLRKLPTAGTHLRTAQTMSHEELRNIAMPPHLQYNSPKSASSPDSANSEVKAGAGSSPELMGPTSRKDSRKRKVSDELEDDDDVDDEDKPVKKTAHNMIEKSARGEDTTEDREELHGLTPAHKLNKATVLSKATEYIRHLEKRNGRLMDENSAMKERIAAFEKLFMAGAMNESQQQFANSPMATAQESNANPAGMINVPEDMKRIISAQMAAGQPYPQIQQQQQQQQQQMQQTGWVNASPYFGKLMVGSLAGLMILEAVREDELSNNEPEGRGLFAIPLQLIGHASSALDLHVMGFHVYTSLKLLLFLGSILWILVPSLFASSGERVKKQQATGLERAPSLASSIDVRRQAWLTAIQTVWVPRHNFLLEASALILKAIKLSLRNAIGVHGYQMLTGLTEEQDTARVKAWSRLVLTLLASGTCPTPVRLMLKALHIRVLLWDLSNSNWQLGAINAIAAKLARKRWNEARQLNRLLARLRRGSAAPHEHELPEHLVALVEQECDDVLSASVVQRAHNLAFNVDTTHNAGNSIDGMDAVVDDAAVGSPMDAVAAWWSTQVLHHVLTATLDENAPALRSQEQNIALAIKVAPRGSAAQIRAALAGAVLLKGSRGENIELARQAMATGRAENTISGSTLMFGPVTRAPDRDLTFTLDCAVAIARLTRIQSKAGADTRCLGLVEGIAKSEHMSSMTLLGFTAVMELMKHLLKHEAVKHELEVTLGKLSSNLRLWMGRPRARKCGVSSEIRNKMVERCLAATKTLTGPDNDTGYGSLSDTEDMNV